MRKTASLRDLKGWQQGGDMEGRCPQISRPPFVSPRCQLLALPGALPLNPGAMAGWGSWGWDLLPVTNHIARDFQPTLSPASRVATVTATTEDADPGDGDGVAERPHCLHLAWGAGLSCL